MREEEAHLDKRVEYLEASVLFEEPLVKVRSRRLGSGVIGFCFGLTTFVEGAGQHLNQVD